MARRPAAEEWVHALGAAWVLADLPDRALVSRCGCPGLPGGDACLTGRPQLWVAPHGRDLAWRRGHASRLGGNQTQRNGLAVPSDNRATVLAQPQDGLRSHLSYAS
jgi:hypothetical protein